MEVYQLAFKKSHPFIPQEVPKEASASMEMTSLSNILDTDPYYFHLCRYHFVPLELLFPVIGLLGFLVVNLLVTI